MESQNQDALEPDREKGAVRHGRASITGAVEGQREHSLQLRPPAVNWLAGDSATNVADFVADF